MESLYMQDLQVCIITYCRTVEENSIAVNKLYNDCMWKFFQSLESSRKLRVLRYFSFYFYNNFEYIL